MTFEDVDDLLRDLADDDLHDDDIAATIANALVALRVVNRVAQAGVLLLSAVMDKNPIDVIAASKNLAHECHTMRAVPLS